MTRIIINVFLFCYTAMALAQTAPLSHAVASVISANTRATNEPSLEQFTNAKMNYHYRSGAIYPIYCQPLNVTDIEFGKTEHITSVSAGDTVRWQVAETFSGADDNYREHLFIKPSTSNIQTNLVVTTDAHTYHLLLISTDKVAMQAVDWIYPPVKPANPVQKSKNQQQIIKGLKYRHLQFGYSVQLKTGKKPDWFPKAVFTDGKKTYIEFPKTMQNAPLLYMGKHRLNDSIINYRVAGNFYIIDSVVDNAQLRLGDNKHVSVVQISRGRQP